MACLSRSWISFAVVMITALGISATTLADEVVTPKIFPYKDLSDGEALNLHVFSPESVEEQVSRTAIVFFFGGGWVGGNPVQFYPQSKHLAKRGMVAIAAEYRVKSRNNSTVSQSVSDAKSAIRYVREHAVELGIDPEKIISSGGSAGGHLAASTGILPGHDEPKENQEISSVPNAMILLNPVVDTTPTGYLNRLLPDKGDESLSPFHHVRAGLAPTLICHGTADKTVLHENVVRFEKAMKAAGNRCELNSFEDAGHGFFNHRPKTMDHYNAVMAHMDEFIDSLGW